MLEFDSKQDENASSVKKDEASLIGDTRGKKEDTTRRHYATLTPALLDRLYDIYRPDFLLYNYTMDAYRDYLPRSDPHKPSS